MKDFEEIYQEFYGPLHGFLLKLAGGDPHIAEELTQETFYQAYVSLHRYNGTCKFFTWLCKIAKNCYFKYLRKNKAAPMDSQALEAALTADEAQSPEQICEQNTMKEELRTAINQLSRRQRDIVILHIYFHQTFQEIAEVLGMKESAVKVAYHRAKEQLKKRLTKHHDMILY